ncbi:hypothetical protein HAX54_034796 [Datura stramonium]|uniref:Uncharacterized protein n=1 Tax=Datura stramonium TaxID=4076 RepID=A0ABS8SEM6_DATST|nr:hypothetical protein [Datura stramonium]
MDTHDDIFSELEPLFDGDEWDHHKISTYQIHKVDDKQLIFMIDQDEQKKVVPHAQKIAIEESDKEVKKSNTDLKTDVDQFVMIDQKHHKKISDDDDVVKQEIGVEIQKSEIILLDSKMDNEVIKKKRHASAIESTNESLVARRTNPRWAHRRATDPPQELIRGKSESRHERINTKDFILPDGWAIEIRDKQKEVVLDAQKIVIEESDKEVKKGDTNLKTDVDQFVMIDQKHHKEISDDDDVVKQENGVEIQKIARRTNPRKAYRRTTDPPQELIRGKSESKREKINVKDLILPDGWATEIHVRVKGYSFGHQDKKPVEKVDKVLQLVEKVIQQEAEAGDMGLNMLGGVEGYSPFDMSNFANTIPVKNSFEILTPRGFEQENTRPPENGGQNI